MQLEIYTAEVVYNGLGTAQANTGVLVQDSGRGQPQIMNITTLRALADIAADVDMEFPIVDKGFAISPAPVNAHIDLCSFSLEDVQVVLDKLANAGISVVGMVTNDADVMRFLLEQSLSGVIYWQVNPTQEDTDTAFNQIVEHLRSFKSKETDTLKVGLAFSNIYSVGIHSTSEALLVKLAQLCKQNKLPLQLEIAKTHEITNTNEEDSQTKTSAIQYLNKIGVLEAQPTLVHMNLVDEEDIQVVQYAGCTVVYCPDAYWPAVFTESSSEKPAYPDSLVNRFPWEMYMKHGVEVAFGTPVQALNSLELDTRKLVQTALNIQNEKMSPLAAVRSAVKGGYRALKMKPPIINKGDSVEKLYVW